MSSNIDSLMALPSGEAPSSQTRHEKPSRNKKRIYVGLRSLALIIAGISAYGLAKSSADIAPDNCSGLTTWQVDTSKGFETFARILNGYSTPESFDELAKVLSEEFGYSISGQELFGLNEKRASIPKSKMPASADAKFIAPTVMCVQLPPPNIIDPNKDNIVNSDELDITFVEGSATELEDINSSDPNSIGSVLIRGDEYDRLRLAALFNASYEIVTDTDGTKRLNFPGKTTVYNGNRVRGAVVGHVSNSNSSDPNSALARIAEQEAELGLS